MIMRFCGVALLLVGTLASAEPFDLKGLKLGTSKDEIAALFTDMVCPPNNKIAEGQSLCFVEAIRNRQLNTIAEKPAKHWTFQFAADGRLQVILVSLDTEHFDAIAAALPVKFGKPSSVSAPTVGNRMGAKFTNDQVRWARGREVLMASRYGADLNTMVLSLGTLDIVENAKGAAAKRAKDL